MRLGTDHMVIAVMNICIEAVIKANITCAFYSQYADAVKPSEVSLTAACYPTESLAWRYISSVYYHNSITEQGQPTRTERGKTSNRGKQQ